MRTATILVCTLLVGCLPAVTRASPLAAFHPPAVLIAMSARELISCRIDAKRRSGFVEVSGIVHANEDVVANARLHVRRNGPGGTSDNTQGGMFGMRAGEEAIVGRVAVNAVSDDDLSAEMTVEWDGGRTACRYP